MDDDKAFEKEGLASIFMDQYKPHADNPNMFEITILPNPDAGPNANQSGLILEVIYTPNYPNELPKLNIKPWKVITAKQCKLLQDKLVEQAQEFIGMQMVYNLTQILKDWLDDQVLNELEKKKEKERAEEEIAMEKEMSEYKRRTQDGTPVTRDGFLSWRTRFLAANPQLPQLGVDERKGRLTGRRIFETMSLSAITELAAKELTASDNAIEKPAQAQVDWGLFAQEGELPDD